MEFQIHDSPMHVITIVWNKLQTNINKESSMMALSDQMKAVVHNVQLCKQTRQFSRAIAQVTNSTAHIYQFQHNNNDRNSGQYLSKRSRKKSPL